jgi:mannose-1-phosphate guanylyltransferase
MNGLVLAAGLGTRFRPFTDIIPKPALPLLNVPIAFYNIHLIQQLGLDRLTVNTHHLPDILKKVLLNHKLNIPITFSDEAGQILGTGGAVKKARPFLEGRGTFVLANADVVNGFGVHDALEFHHREEAMATLVVMAHPEAGKKYGAIWVDSKNRVISIGRNKPSKIETKPFHFVGLHFIEESIFKYIPDGPSGITDIYLDAIKKGETVLAFEKEGFWFDAGTLEDYLEATESLLELLPRLQHEPYLLSFYRRFWPHYDQRANLWEGQNCEHLLTLGSNSKILMGDRCLIHPEIIIEGFAVFGDDVIIEKNVELKNVVVGPGVRVKAGEKHHNTLLLK